MKLQHQTPVVNGVALVCPACGLQATIGMTEDGVHASTHTKPPCETWEQLDPVDYATYCRRHYVGPDA